MEMRKGDLRRIVSQHMAVQDANPIEIAEENHDREEPQNKHGDGL